MVFLKGMINFLVRLFYSDINYFFLFKHKCLEIKHEFKKQTN